MSVNERLRLDTFKRVKRGELSVSKAARLLGVSLRQGRRLWKSFQLKGCCGSACTAQQTSYSSLTQIFSTRFKRRKVQDLKLTLDEHAQIIDALTRLDPA